MIDVKKVKEALLTQKKLELSGNLYHKTQVGFSYHTNSIEGSTITLEETESIFERGTVLADTEKVLVLKDMTETKNHFALFDYMLDSIDEPLTEEMIKKYHYIIKEATLTEKEKKWFNLGDYKKVANYVSEMVTSSPDNVAKDMTELMEWYKTLEKKTINDIIEYHARFEKIHPFQDGNGRVGRMIIFRECLYNDIMPFFIEEHNKDFYIRGLKEYQSNREKGYLTDTCLNSQDNYIKLCEFFLEGIDD